MRTDKLSQYISEIDLDFPKSRHDYRPTYIVTAYDRNNMVRVYTFHDRKELFQWVPEAGIKFMAIDSDCYHREFWL